jgi:hypothetical protein
MGARLRREVEQQLIADLRHYGLVANGLSIDWSQAVQEGHMTEVLEGTLEALSGLVVRNSSGAAIADGWMDFVHGGGENPLFVFWLFLAVGAGAERRKVKAGAVIPNHVWLLLPEASQRLCVIGHGYDSRWADDPSVRAWRASHAS